MGRLGLVDDPGEEAGEEAAEEAFEQWVRAETELLERRLQELLFEAWRRDEMGPEPDDYP